MTCDDCIIILIPSTTNNRDLLQNHGLPGCCLPAAFVQTRACINQQVSVFWAFVVAIVLP
jgi:hypothetical protein